MSRGGRNGDWPPRTTPIRPAGGIRAQSRHGAFTSGWWAKRWIAVLEAFNLGTRLTRGRSYARAGRVTQIAIELGGVRAQVEGSRPKPYDVTIHLRQLEAEEWRAVGAAITSDVRLCAALLAGEMPEDIERAFTAAGTSLFPLRADEMKTACSCPDWSNPCKHVAAVFYLIGEEFDRDPFLLLSVRGRAREGVRDLFGSPDAEDTSLIAPSPTPKRGRKTRVVSAPPATLPEVFWGNATHETKSAGAPIDMTPPGEPAVLKRAGKFPFWRADIALTDALVPLYDDAATFALNRLADRGQARKD